MIWRDARGFTLVEVMVALAVTAVALPALLFLLDQQIDGTAYIRNRAHAQWVAANRLAEVRLLALRPDGVSVGRANGESELAGRIWYWSTVTEATPVPGFLRVDVRVANTPDAEAGYVSSLSAFLAADTPQTSP